MSKKGTQKGAAKTLDENSSQEELYNLADYLAQSARKYPNEKAVVCIKDGKHVTYTFRELEDETNRIAHGLKEAGMKRGMRTIVLVRASLDFFSLFFAILRIGAVPVMIDPAMGRANLIDSLASVRAEAFVALSIAHVLRILKSKAFKDVKVVVTVGRRWFWGGYTLDKIKKMGSTKPFPLVKTRPDEMAAIFFTSGSTGPPKGVVYEHSMILSQMEYIASLGYRHGEVDLSTFPLFALYDAAQGLPAIIPDMDPTKPGDADPAKLVAAIHKYKCTHMFGSPALLTNLANYSEKTGEKIPSMKVILTAGAPVHPVLLRKLNKMIAKEGQIFTPYGATESLPVSRIGSNEILSDTWKKTEKGGGTCVGKPFPGMKVKIIKIDEAPIDSIKKIKELKTGEIGEIIVQGGVTTREYFAKPKANAAAKIPDPGSKVGFWHRMGDIGYFDDTGRLWFCGRNAHKVETKKGYMFTVPCEAIFNTHEKVFRSALVGVGKAGSQKPVLCVEIKEEHAGADKEALKKELLKRAAGNPKTKDIKTLLFHESFPVDVRHNAKINRELLSVWAAEQL